MDAEQVIYLSAALGTCACLLMFFCCMPNHEPVRPEYPWMRWKEGDLELSNMPEEAQP